MVAPARRIDLIFIALIFQVLFSSTPLAIFGRLEDNIGLAVITVCVRFNAVLLKRHGFAPLATEVLLADRGSGVLLIAANRLLDHATSGSSRAVLWNDAGAGGQDCAVLPAGEPATALLAVAQA
jgi:hypothetical protein